MFFWIKCGFPSWPLDVGVDQLFLWTSSSSFSWGSWFSNLGTLSAQTESSSTKAFEESDCGWKVAVRLLGNDNQVGLVFPDDATWVYLWQPAKKSTLWPPGYLIAVQWHRDRTTFFQATFLTHSFASECTENVILCRFKSLIMKHRA